MKTIVKNFALLLTLCCLAVHLQAQQIEGLKIIRGKSDTVYTKQFTLLGVAEPGSKITINGEDVFQYKTGSFGKEIVLTEGANPVKVSAQKGEKVYNDEFSLFYSQAPQRKLQVKQNLYPGRVVVSKKGAYFNYGAGRDRLGGAKINYIDEGIRMEVIDSVENLLKVKLSDNRYAYIPKDFVNYEVFGTPPPKSLTSSWSVINSGTQDIVRVALEDRLPYIVREELDPSRIVLDIFGAECNTNWITQYLDLKAVEYVDLNQIDGDIFRVIIKLRDKYSWGYKVSYSGNSLVVSVKHTPSLNFKDLVIGLDAGHGGSATGAVSISGIQEKDLNLSMVLFLKEELEKRGAKVVLSRSEDVDVQMNERKDIFDKANIDLLISVHCNAGGNPLKPGGTSTYYRHVEYRELAETILKRLTELDVKNFGLIGNFNFTMNAPTNYPSVLVETLFMSSLPDEEKIADPEFRKELMKRVVKGLEDYLSSVKKSIRK